jgi:glycosyltransferase involved in cell wall biosynthesis
VLTIFCAPNLIMTPSHQTLTVAWISDFPIEWLPDIPAELRHLPRRHPATWQMAMVNEYEKNSDLQLHVIVLRGRIARDLTFIRNGVTFHVIKAKPKWRLASLYWLDTILIRKVLQQIKAKVVHAWGSEKGAGLIAARLGLPYVMTIQGLLDWYKHLIPPTLYDRFLAVVETLSLRRAQVVTAESNFPAQYIRQHFPNRLVYQVEHVPNGLFLDVHRAPITQPVKFIIVAGLGYRKGYDLLFAALEQLLPELEFTLTIVADPNPMQQEALRARASEKLWARVEFKWHLLPQEVAKELETATMLLMPTRADTGPVAVKEAVVAGVPVVASEIGGIPDYIVPGRNGELFPSGDVPAFVAAIRRACAHPLFREGRVDAATLMEKRVYLSPARMADGFLEVYRAAVARKH